MTAGMKAGEIRLDGVSRRFRIVHDRSATLKETVVRRRRAEYTELWALKCVDLHIAPGESVGIVGRNGSGKSTLLKLLAGILPPHEGTVRTAGTLAAMLELGSGFHPDFTGRENIFMNGAIHGMSEKDVEASLDAIIAFAELQDFIDMPVRTYSSGMAMRLAFAVSSHINPNILLLDEVLAVGDEAFQRKCMGRIQDFKRGGGTLVFVSHDPATVERVCDRAVLIDGGQVVFDGDPSEIISRYHRLLAEETQGLGAHLGDDSGGQEEPAYDPDAVLPTDVVEVRDCRLMREGQAVSSAVCGDSITIELDLVAHDVAPDAVVGMSLATETGTALYGVSTRGHSGSDTASGAIADALASPGSVVTVGLTIPSLPLQEGSVDVYVGVSSGDEARQYMGGRRVLRFSVFSDEAAVGLVAMNTTWHASIQTREATP
jgi:ABC-type polysaccharide/polyol phosphate transport system ATPase subunit